MGWAPGAGPDIRINFIRLNLMKLGVALGAGNGSHWGHTVSLENSSAGTLLFLDPVRLESYFAGGHLF